MIEKIFDPIFAPFRWLRSKVFSVKQIPDTVKGEAGRVKSEAGSIRGDFTGNGGSQRAAGGPGKSAAVNSAGAASARPAGRKMGLFSRKQKCPECGKALHPSWD